MESTIQPHNAPKQRPYYNNLTRRNGNIA